jgi:hypothetical protein
MTIDVTDDPTPEELPKALSPGIDPTHQYGLTVGLMPNVKAPGGRQVLHFSGFTEFMLGLRESMTRSREATDQQRRRWNA